MAMSALAAAALGFGSRIADVSPLLASAAVVSCTLLLLADGRRPAAHAVRRKAPTARDHTRHRLDERRRLRADDRDRWHSLRSSLFVLDRLAAGTDEPAGAALRHEIERIRRTLDGHTDEATIYRIDRAVARATQAYPDLSIHVAGEHSWIVGQEAKLEESIRLLLDNVVRHAHARAVQLLLEHDDEVVTISLIDDGVGIPARLHDRIFERGVTTAATGTGIGLDVARTLVEQQGGDLTMVPTHRGSMFRIRLPVAVADDPRRSDNKS